MSNSVVLPCWVGPPSWVVFQILESPRFLLQRASYWTEKGDGWVVFGIMASMVGSRSEPAMALLKNRC